MSKFEIVWRALNGPRLLPEYKFHPTRRWRIDWWHESGVAIEIEGAIWAKGRHTRGSGFLGDMEKYNALSERGVLLFRVPAHQINSKWLSPIIYTINRGGSMSYLSLMKEVQNA
ncbi:hypothetical protein EBR03_06365 [bacterium]|nr:hypothetical protein [bacterium]